ncbi:MAG: hypothetical protein RL701_1994 [Pseudomonadota bacterium]|jgi:hypothetical protein
MNPDNLAQLTKIATWEIERLAYLMTKLKATSDGADGTGASSNLPYNSAIFLSSDISDGDRHNHDEMPVTLAGRTPRSATATDATQTSSRGARHS